MPRSIDLNCDLGEHDDFARSPDAEILAYVSTANVSCAVHAGTPESIALTVQEALRRGVAIGAHPSYPDREGFGRRSLLIELHELAASVREQVLWLDALVRQRGGRLSHLKPHGALYNDLVADPARVAMLCDVIKDVDPSMALMGMAQSAGEEIAARHGVRWIGEGFADRRYDGPTSLRSRAHADAVITDPEDVLAQVDRLLEGPIDSICLHGDTPDARALARRIREHLDARGIEVRPAG